MTASAREIRDASSDKELSRLLQANLIAIFPPEVRNDSALYLSELRNAPRGLRAMAATYDLDVSIALDDLAWHFTNHPERELADETLHGLRELEANEAADIFEKAFSIIKPHLPELNEFLTFEDGHDRSDWIEAKGIQAQIDPLNRQMWNLIHQLPENSLFHYWYIYARKYPERCVP